MTTPIGAVSGPHIEHGILLDLVIPTQVYVTFAQGTGGLITFTFQDPGFEPFEAGTTITVNGINPSSYNGTYTVLSATETQVIVSGTATETYQDSGQIKGSDRRWYISNCYNPITYNGKEYKALGGFLQVSNIQQDLVTTNNEIQVSLSAIPKEYIENILGQPIKGGAIRMYRVFFDPDTKQIANVDGVRQIFKRYQGIITNWAVNEDIQDGNNGQSIDITYTIGIMCSSVVGVLENRVAGRRTINSLYQVRYYERNITDAIITDLSMARIEQLKNASFDFGRPPK